MSFERAITGEECLDDVVLRWIDRYPWLFLGALCAVLVALWLPSVQYPILSDTANYAVLGKSLWHGRGYALVGEPYARHLPLHALLSYPFVALAGDHIGMKLSSLLGGMAVIIVSFVLCRRRFGVPVAAGVAVTILFHHGFLWMTVVGSADLLFTALSLGAILAWFAAEDDKRWYVLSGIFIGLASLTRYNGVPLFGFFVLATLFWRRSHLRSWWFIGGLLAGVALFALWPLRNALVFGNPFYSDYTSELSRESLGPFMQILSNAFYYAHPLHNILPILLAFAFYGMWHLRRRQAPLLLAILFLELLTAIWWVQAMRFAFPAYPIVLGFAFWGIQDIYQRLPLRFRAVSVVLLMVGLFVTHLSALCLYAFPACNAAFDRRVGIIPKNLGITSEGFYAFDQARDWLNANAEAEASVFLTEPLWKTGVFREDLHLTPDRAVCPLYRITDASLATEEILFTTPDEPKVSVVVEHCP